jgi:hypothetical protein
LNHVREPLFFSVLVYSNFTRNFQGFRRLPKDIHEIADRVAEFVTRKPPVKKREDYKYSETVKTSFERIKRLRDEEYGFDEICEGCEHCGLLRDISIGSFRQAYYRELSRQRRLAGTGADGPDIKRRSRCVEAGNSLPEKTAEKEGDQNEGIEQEASGGYQKLVVNPDNTFVIRPIDRDYLPEFK